MSEFEDPRRTRSRQPADERQVPQERALEPGNQTAVGASVQSHGAAANSDLVTDALTAVPNVRAILQHLDSANRSRDPDQSFLSAQQAQSRLDFLTDVLKRASDGSARALELRAEVDALVNDATPLLEASFKPPGYHSPFARRFSDENRAAADKWRGELAGAESSRAGNDRDGSNAAAGANRSSDANRSNDPTGLIPGSAPAQLAERGVSDASAPLPHLQTLQPLFGRHDLSGIKAQVGGPATDAAGALGANAYAVGDRVGFAGEPDLHTAAHEAAHVVQQDAGVALKAEVDGGDGDPHEQQADAIADAVVRGESVERQLDRAPTSSRARVHRAREGNANAAPARDPLTTYLDIHQVDLRDAVARQLSDTRWPDPANDVRWAPGGERAFSLSVWHSLVPKFAYPDTLRKLVHTGSLEERFHRYVDLKTPNWSPAFGQSVGQLMSWAIRDALADRVGRRYRSLWASRNEPPEADEIVGAHPMDRLVAHALVEPGVVDLSESPATQPVSAKTEAKEKQSPAKANKGSNAGEPGKAAAGGAPTLTQLMAIERNIGQRLDAIRDRVVRLGYSEQLREALTARADRVALLVDADEATRSHYLPILQFQHAQLIAIEPHLEAAVAKLWPLRGIPDFAISPERKAERDGLTAMVNAYVRAAATSHDKERSTAALRTIEERARWRERDRLDAAQVNAQTALDESVQTTHSERGDVEGIDHVRRQRQSMIDGTARGRSSYEQRKAVTIAGEVALRARMRSTEHALTQLLAVATEVYGDPSKLSELLPGFKPLPAVILDVKDHLADVDRTWDAGIAENTTIQDEPNAPDDWADWKAREKALPLAQRAFAKIAGDQNIVDFLRNAAKEIRHQQMLDAVLKLAGILLITVATGMGAAALGARAAAALATESSGFALRGLAFVADVSINVSINTAVQLAVSAPPGGGKGGERGPSDGSVVGWALLENALMEVFTRGLMTPLRKAQDAALKEGRALAALPHLSEPELKAVSSFDFAGTQMMAEMVGGMTTQWAARRLVETFHKTGEEVTEPFALTVLQQGAAIGLGKYFHGQLAAWMKHRAALLKTSRGQSPEGKALIAARDAFYAESKELSESLSPDPASGERLSLKNVELLKQERAILATHESVEHTQGTGDATVRANHVGETGSAGPAHETPVALEHGNDVATRGQRKAGEQTNEPRSKATASNDRVTEPVPGWHDSLDPDFQPPGWQITDRGPPQPHPEHPELLQITTDVVAPDGSTGWIQRSYDPTTRTVVMENAFLSGLPKWIEAGKPMVGGKGSPTVTYLTVRQMKKLNVAFGTVDAFKMSTIQNIEAVMHLEMLRRGKSKIKDVAEVLHQSDPAVRARELALLQDGVPKTHSVTYASTSIQQSGHEVRSVDTKFEGAFAWTLEDMMNHFRMKPAQREAMFKKFGLGPKDHVLVNYDILIKVGPHPKNPN